MKKSLLALAVLGAFAGVASAQSSVSLYGTVDLSAKYVKNDGSARRLSLSQDGINSSQLGFKGTEDLGGGLKAGFLLLSGINADTGSANTKFWNRRSTVSLWGNFGEVRLGRDYTPTFWNNTIFDAFGTNGLGDSTHVQQIASAASYGLTGANAAVFATAGINNTFVRADNSIGYLLPSNIGGVYGQFMAAASEGAPAAAPCTLSVAAGGTGTCVGAQSANAAQINNPGRYVGGRIGFAAGPFDVAVAYAQQRLDLFEGKQKVFNVGGSYDLGVVKLLGYFAQDKIDVPGFTAKESRYSISGVVPLGQGEIHAGYSHSKLTNDIGFTDDSKVGQLALGYVYNLSKRTAVYSTVSRVDNNGAARNSVTSGTAQTAAPTADGKSTGVEFGLRHFF